MGNKNTHVTVAITEKQYKLLLAMARKEQKSFYRQVSVGMIVRRILDKELFPKKGDKTWVAV